MNQHQKAFVKLLNELAYKHSQTTVLRDFAEMGALAFANAFPFKNDAWHAREKQYLAVAKRYKKDELELFSQMLSEITLSLEEEVNDAIGEIYMSEIRTKTKWDADVEFTPPELSKLIARVALTDFTMPDRGYFRLCEPACGTGGMVIAAATVLREQGVNYQKQMHVTAVEVRAELAHLTYIQLSLLHIPAVVIHGNTLSLEEWSSWKTPAHTLGFWDGRFPITLASVQKAVAERGQVSLFSEESNATVRRGSRKSKNAVGDRNPRGEEKREGRGSGGEVRHQPPRARNLVLFGSTDGE